MSKVVFYTYPSCTSCRRVKAWFLENGVSFEERHIFKNPPTPEELMKLSVISEEGIDSLVSVRSNRYRQLGINHLDMKFSELLKLLSSEPKLLRRPIVTDGTYVTVGYNVDMLQLIAKHQKGRKTG
ncbi:Spx/MgsR family RNA polymerase-binding regulatory protein [Desulfuribacillus alkaliarsenatis]|uniref:Transcriptional regulator n=1 Tax=Desulfuribacillus alkaliarsenatis TaxID=766136 RepID=A0A1E5G0X2_9FIRM|nr:Spx/MgsR family RNA polymerase-binding regulatory protein [Desulfuribacillus alkaliarsenatis]OEF96474.1 hypothetical protein BHF68_07395 [Desulfuribacillus alkaliarsenatis]